MDHMTIEQSLHRIVALGQQVEGYAIGSDQLAPAKLQEYLATLGRCVHHLAGIVQQVAENDRLETADAGYKF
jgi:hypothetical protein